MVRFVNVNNGSVLRSHYLQDRGHSARCVQDYVELKGLRSNEFEEDLSRILKAH